MRDFSYFFIHISLVSTFVLAPLLAFAETTDSLRTTDIEELVIVATPKEDQRLRQQPLSSTAFSQSEMRQRGVLGITDLSAQVPGVFIPAYGSHLTTSIYVRGVGSRTGTPAVALYVDGVPQMSAASYDFNFSDVDRVDVLRGPQGTLYGRNAMGGVIRVFTKNPFSYQGTDITLGGSSASDDANRGRFTLTHYHRVSDRFAFSANFFGDVDGGYFRNAARGNELIDSQKDFGARMRFILRPNSTLSFDLTASHEWLDQGGYPYEYRGVVGTPTTPEPITQVGQIAYNNRSGYRRNLTNVGLTAEKRWSLATLTSITGFQHLNDQMDLDQDFTDVNLYTLQQRQNQNAISEELILKNHTANGKWSKCKYSWLFGASVQHQWLTTQGPVTFHDDGLLWLNGLINQQGNAHLPTIVSHDAAGAVEYTMNFIFNNLIQGTELAFPGTYDTPSTNLAIFHQSSLKNLFNVENLDLTAGLRLDYERRSLHYDASYAFGQSYGLGGRLTYPDGHVRDGMVLVGAQQFNVVDELQLKLTLQWAPSTLNSQLSTLNFQPSTLNSQLSTFNLYATFSSGYRSGGYNIQMFSDLLQDRMRTAIMHNVATTTVPVVDAVTMIPADVKQNVRQMLIDMGTQGPTDVDAATRYRPETSQNIEVGSHLNLFDARLQADLAAFLVQTRDQQISIMSAGGLGRITKNNGRSRSLGAEATLRALLTDALDVQCSYAFTDARSIDTDFYVPFVPRHTLYAGATQTWSLRPAVAPLTSVSLHADYRGAGRIYWTETNSAWQDFCGTLNARLTLGFQPRKADINLSFYATNILGTRYQTFYFETMQRGFAQYSRPTEFGLELRFRL